MPDDSKRQDDAERAVQTFLEWISQPETSSAEIVYGGKKDEHRRLLEATCQNLFQRVELLAKKYKAIGKRKNEDATLSGLNELYLGSDDTRLDAESIYGQIDLQNTVLHRLLKKSVKKLSKSASSDNDSESNTIRLLEDMESSSSSEAGEENESAASDAGDDDDDDGDEDAQRIRERMDRVMDGMDDDEDEDEKPPAEEEEELFDPVAEDLKDGFFDLNEMEAFADEEEEYLPDEAFGEEKPEKKTDDEKPKKSFHRRQRDGDLTLHDDDDESDDDEDDFSTTRRETTIRRRKYRKDDEIEALYSMYKASGGSNDEDDDEEEDVIHMTAADIFGAPNQKYYHKYYKSSKKRDTGSWDDEERRVEDDKNAGWGNAASDGNDDEDDDDVAKSDTVEDDTERPSKKSKLEQQTEQLEKEMLAEKPWQMTGEATATARPVNSLLESTPEFQAASKPAPMITVQHTRNLEEVIQQRILNEDWDDVVPRELPDVGWNQQRGELPEVSQEKSKLGLGELYEREYLLKTAGHDVAAAEKQSSEDIAKNEMKSLFANLCSKLDALSNYHFAPRPIADEAQVRTVTAKPAIAMEEVLPLHVSDARGVAPQEVYGTKRGRDGVLKGESELDSEERKRLRAAKKAARRKARKEKQADEKLISRLQPGLGLNNPYEKRKMRQELEEARAHGKVTQGQADTTDYGASGTFFQRLQDEAKRTIRGDVDDAEKSANARKSRSSSSGALKL